MKSIKQIAVFVIFISLLLTGCGKPDMEGIILEAKENQILLAQDLSSEEFEDIKDKSATDLQNEDVHGERESLGLIELTYGDAENFEKGDKVEVWINGDILDSYPGQAEAKKVSKQ